MELNGKNVRKEIFAKRVRREITRKGLTYDEVARHMREHLPADTRLSTVSIWAYANGRALPRKPAYLQALAKTLGVDVHELLQDRGASAEGSESVTPQEAAERMLKVTDLDGDRAVLQIKQNLNWTVALEIIKIIRRDSTDYVK